MRQELHAKQSIQLDIWLHQYNQIIHFLHPKRWQLTEQKINGLL